jgi:hypothetical protein
MGIDFANEKIEGLPLFFFVSDCCEGNLKIDNDDELVQQVLRCAICKEMCSYKYRNR